MPNLPHRRNCLKPAEALFNPLALLLADLAFTDAAWAFQGTLVEEFNTRYADKRPLRFQLADTARVGDIVEGYSPAKLTREIRFQNALHATRPYEFEKLAAIILKVLGCKDVFFTPSSHDQGVDAFGYQDLVAPTPYGTTHGLTWIAQAKHYLSSQVGLAMRAPALGLTAAWRDAGHSQDPRNQGMTCFACMVRHRFEFLCGLGTH